MKFTRPTRKLSETREMKYGLAEFRKERKNPSKDLSVTSTDTCTLKHCNGYAMIDDMIEKIRKLTKND